MISSIRRKIALACMAVVMLVATAATTTYAWFSLNDSAWIEGFEMEIETTDNLLISSDGENFKQSLTNADLVEAYNRSKGTATITNLSDIKLAPVTTIDGINFNEWSIGYDDMNKQSITPVPANEKSYVTFKLKFMVEANSTLLPDYDFKFITTNVGDLKGTSFTSEDQTLTLVNKMVNNGADLKSGDQITVNPVNALRVGVVQESGAFIYNVGTSGLGKTSVGATTADLGGNANAANAATNAMYTYFNNIHNGILSPMEDVTATEKADFSEPMGVFTYDGTAYNEIELTLELWIEGYDADNLVGLNTTDIKVLLTFEATDKS